jgi:hypothetical protein
VLVSPEAVLLSAFTYFRDSTLQRVFVVRVLSELEHLFATVALSLVRAAFKFKLTFLVFSCFIVGPPRGGSQASRG